MSVIRLRSTKLREDFLEKDDNHNLLVAMAGGGAFAPQLAGATTTGVPTEQVLAAVVAAAANNQTLAAVAGKRTYISAFHVGGLGATAASVIAITITGLFGGMTLTYRLNIPAGVAVIVPDLIVEFNRPIPGNADNTAIVVNVPSFGAGNTAAEASARGFSI